jgi:tight adherence protein C
MFAGIDFFAWSEVIAAWLTFRIAGADFDPLHSAILIAALAAAIVCAIRLWSIGQREDRQRRLEGLRGSTAQRRALASAMPWYRRLGVMIATKQLVNAAEQQKLLSELSAAGLKGHHHLATLIAAKLIAAIGFVVLFWLFLQWTGYFAGSNWVRLAALAGGFIAGWRFPEAVISRIAARRRARLELGFPDALDLLVICAEAGLALDQAIEEVGTHLRRSNPEIAQEFMITAAEMQILPDRSQALDNLARRSGLVSLRSLVAALSQSIRFGTSVADSLRIIALEMRAERTVRFEERAARLPVLLTIPLMGFILPSLIIIIGAPLVFRIVDTLGSIMGAKF